MHLYGGNFFPKTFKISGCLWNNEGGNKVIGFPLKYS